MDKEVIKAMMELGKQAAIIYQSALEESGSTEVARAIVEIYIKTLIKPDTTTKFFM